MLKIYAGDISQIQKITAITTASLIYPFFFIQPPQTAISQPDETPIFTIKLGITVIIISSVAVPFLPLISPFLTFTTLDPVTPERPNLGLYPDLTSANSQLSSIRLSSIFRIPPAVILNTVTAISAAY
jgi:hypothetical protein